MVIFRCLRRVRTKEHHAGPGHGDVADGNHRQKDHVDHPINRLLTEGAEGSTLLTCFYMLL